jgi:hypothetical protein
MKKSRREFLKLVSSYTAMGMSASAFNTLVDVLLGNQINQAFGADLGSQSPGSKFIYIQEYGAPERWVFDLFLDPYNQGGLTGLPLEGASGTLNKQVVNYYTGNSSRLLEPVYKFANVKGLKLPYMWSQKTGAASGERPIADLLDHMLAIRGINTGNGIHTLSSQLQIQPSIGGSTLTGIVADSSSSPIGHVAINPVFSPYQSPQGKGRLTLGASANGGTNLIDRIQQPFKNENPFVETGDLDSHLLNKINSFDEALNDTLRAKKQLSASSEASLKGAKDIMFDKINKMIGDYPSLKEKYVNIIAATMNIAMPGINDRPVGSTDVNSRGNTYQLHGEKVVESDIRNIIPYNNYKASAGSLDYLADLFAFTEFATVNNLSDSVHIRSIPWRNLKFQARTTGNAFSRTRSQTFDAHSYGGMVQIQLMTSYYSALSACMLELIDQLKSANLWKDTVMQLGGEFCRRPRKDGTGSDHAGYATNISLFSGKVNSPKVVGNTRVSTHGTYYGSYGASSERDDGREINLGNVASTVAQMLKVESSSPNNASLVSMNGDEINIPDSQLAKNKGAA